MNKNLFEILQDDPTLWQQCKDWFVERHIPTKTTLLHEGQISQNIYFIKQGCLRMWFNNNGKDITFQFFFENTMVSSIESFMGRKQSDFSLESIEPSTLVQINHEHFMKLLKLYPSLKDDLQNVLFERMGNYARLFLSRIKNNPQERYYELLREHPEIFTRIPQHYIASFLGITPISLSRIRNKRQVS